MVLFIIGIMVGAILGIGIHCMLIVAKEQLTEYIAYSKIAVNNMKSSGNLKITLKDLLAQIDILPKIYSKEKAIDVANKI